MLEVFEADVLYILDVHVVFTILWHVKTSRATYDVLRAECIIYTLSWGLKWRGSQFGTASLTMKMVIFLEVQETMGPSLIVDSYSIITFIIVFHFYVEISD